MMRMTWMSAKKLYQAMAHADVMAEQSCKHMTYSSLVSCLLSLTSDIWSISNTPVEVDMLYAECV